jgi:hypothetical protein
VRPECLRRRPISLPPQTESSPCIHCQSPPLHLLTRNFTHRFGPDKVVSWVASFELFERFVTKHHVTPVPLDIGLGELQSAALVSLRQVFCCLKACKPRRCTVLCTVMWLTSQTFCLFSSLAITRLERRRFLRIFLSTVCSTLFESFLGRPARWASSSEPESLYFAIQRVTKWW